MGLSCSPRKPTPSISDRIEQQVRRDNGLSSIFNINTQIIPCTETFVRPTYSMSGTCKPVTGLTITDECVYNLSNINNFDITFNFTGSTKYTGYTGEFCYRVRPGDVTFSELPTDCVAYSGITGGSVTVNINTLPLLDSEYLVDSYDIFQSQCDSGLTVNTLNFLPITITKLGDTPVTTKFTNKDFYFVTVVNPPKPLLTFIPFNIFTDITFINENIFPTTTGSNTFLLQSKPVGDVVVLSVNGVTVSTEDYTVDSINKLVTISSGITLESIDVVQAYYNTTPLTNESALALNNSVKFEVFSVTGITSGVTSSFSATTFSNFVNNNTTENRLEIFLTEKIDPFVDPVVTINGVNLAFNIDVFKSNVVDNKLVLKEGTVIEVGDIISVYYYHSGFNDLGDLGELKTNTPTFRWTSQTSLLNNIVKSNASFIVEIANRNDPSFSTILKTGSTIYNNNILSYTLDVGPLTTTSIVDYIYRIRFRKEYTTSVVSNTYVTESISDTGSFSLNWGYINNTKF